ncbi:hypothetical protein B0J13DRAFT_445594 [Dactylonectria estremocensis]|uniref:Zn(2)-C6 fungal-type domain-containing protein n=1 Tax=Dactylonectria estremocensis TaxID=1079267 RepID=A0A9P9J0X7_9HYPO|nr:hypothetical protein B0J13DRAFT_445594 [Dactylonectria estremocensis]
MQHLALLSQGDDSPPASPPEIPPDGPPRKTRARTRSRTTTACNACRARRTKCDSRKPACGYCRTRGVECHYECYEQSQPGPTSRVEAQLAAMNERLDHITSLLPYTQQPPRDPQRPVIGQGQGNHVFTGQEKLPFQLLGTDCIMTTLGLSPGFAQELARLERKASPVGVGHGPRVCLIQQHQALAALAAFSAHVHIWYPVLRPAFSERYLGVISGPLTPGSESCMVLLVAAIGMLAQQDHALGASPCDNNSELYLEAAMSSLPAVLVESSIESVQCLVLLSIYHCCLCRPLQAYDYAMIASFKVQNLLRYVDASDAELHEDAKRAYWAVLLLESELTVQFDVVHSRIWDHDDKVALPDGRRAWQFDVDVASPQSATTSSPATIGLADNLSTDRMQSYFLAEISMRRMLHRCNTAISKRNEDEIVYAPNIALELELQVDEWYRYLPDLVRFQHLDYDVDLSAPPHSLQTVEPLGNFLRVQYYCCKLSIYWPAVYQSIQDGIATSEVLRHCEKFFDAYIKLMPSILVCLRHCIVNRWTLFATIFMTSMAVIQGSQTRCLRDGCAVDWSRLLECLRSTRSVDRRIVEASVSLSLLDSALSRRLPDTYSLLDGTSKLD